jgi:hypothetical protein
MKQAPTTEECMTAIDAIDGRLRRIEDVINKIFDLECEIDNIAKDVRDLENRSRR